MKEIVRDVWNEVTTAFAYRAEAGFIFIDFGLGKMSLLVLPITRDE